MSSHQATRPPLQTLLALRRGAEEAAARALEAATLRRAAAEARQAELDAEVRAAREELRSRRSSGGGAGAATAALGIARERFWERLREGVAALAVSAAAHRDDPLAAARAGVVEAAAAHRAARAARELMEKVCEKAEGARRRIEARRTEVAADEQAQAVAAANRAVNPGGPPSSRGSNPR